MRPSLAVVLLALAAPAPLSSSAAAQAPGPAVESPAADGPRHHRSHGRRGRSTTVARGLGFRMNPDGTSRCSVHVAGTVTPTSSASRRRFEVTLPGAAVASRNDLHPLETEFFNTPMRRAHLVRRGRDLVLVVELRDDVTPTMRVEADPAGGIVVIVDLQAGHYVDGPPSLGGGSVHLVDEPPRADGSNRSGSGEASVRPTAAAPEPRPAPAPTSRSDHADEERPPAFGGH